ncbi:biotin holocarboxylase synthetase [Recurvomyces mirabilis]|uniref:Biotin holocarboxylase synthetase n=1 Tax=Recurvomyces mirabilis TaxID=574656 RepID=A0AAE0WX73_9PEZI|nr:biotin holocarboxylase synthetase [Recurvomyces mirabilis]KAK5158775.1 biotin holocarboxylase synthetase [Recurvomyces mirabilis]
MSVTNKKLNVLMYAGTGATISSVKHTTWSLRRLLGPHYAVLTVTGDQILNEPWSATCALLVFPGGADLGYCRTLNGEGNRRIMQYVQLGGKYLGLCAGGYYGCARCEFEVGRKGMEVVGSRELGFYPGTCRGLAFEGFVYHSEAGTRAAEISVNGAAFGSEAVPGRLKVYYNGGGVFVHAEKYKNQGVEVLASYAEDLAVESGEGKAAVVYCTNLNASEPSAHYDYAAVVTALREDETKRTDFMKACLTKLGLQVSQETEAVPILSRLHLSSSQPSNVSELLASWHEQGVLSKRDDGTETIEGENDRFILHQAGRWDMNDIQEALPSNSPTSQAQADDKPPDSLIDYNTIPKHLVAHESSLPSGKETPHFNHHAFFSNLSSYHSQQKESSGDFGKTLLYGEVVTSTSTLLEKNTTWLSNLPDGFTATATTQVAGRGRGTNVWVSPPGSLMFSTVLRHSLSLSTKAPVVFVQYIIAMAIVAGIQGYEKGGYNRIPVRLKWPNDIYALDPTVPEKDEKKYVKIGGILVNSSYAGGDYTLVCGIGLNVSNPSPTTSLSLLAQKLNLPPFTLERLLASILANFEGLYTRFCRTGWDKEFQGLYYGAWLHTDQIVVLETEGGARARIKGITSDWGLLVAEEVVGEEGRVTGKRFALQSDSNSFDFFRGLLRRKM